MSTDSCNIGTELEERDERGKKTSKAQRMISSEHLAYV